MQVSKLLEIIRIKLDDPIFNDSDNDSLFKTDELLYYINNALREIVFRGKLLVSNENDIQLLTNESEYDVPERVINIELILDENNKEITKIQEIDIDSHTDDWRNDSSDIPYHFIQNLTNNKLIFYPTPSRDSTVTIRGTLLPEEVTESSYLPDELSEIYQPDLIYWVLYEAFDKPDADTYAPKKAEKNLKRFTDVFGIKPNADVFKEIMEFPDDPGSLKDY